MSMHYDLRSIQRSAHSGIDLIKTINQINDNQNAGLNDIVADRFREISKSIDHIFSYQFGQETSFEEWARKMDEQYAKDEAMLGSLNPPQPDQDDARTAA